MNGEGANVISHLIGEFGKWQATVSLLVSLLKLPIGWFQLSIVFLAPVTRFWCQTPLSNLSRFNDATTSEWRNETLNNCDIECSEYAFDATVFKRTIISEWLLICEKEQLANVVQMSFMLGVLIGNVVFGIASDRFGRKIPLIITIALQGVTSFLVAFVPWFFWFLVLRFVLAISTGGIMITSFVLCVEMVSGKWRTSIPILYQIPFGLANSLMAVMAYFLRDWRKLTFTMSIISMSFISYWWLVPESPRWLLAVGKNEKAAKILEKAAKTNNLKSSDVARIVCSLSDDSRMKPKSKSNSSPFLGLFKTPKLRRNTLILFFNWFVAGMSVFGFSQYISFIGKDEDIFIHFTVGGLVTIPGTLICILVVNRFGRKKTIITSGYLYGLACMLVNIVPTGLYPHDWPKILLAGISLTCMSIAFPALYLYSGELFPTVARNGGLGVSSMFARIGSMIAPFVLSARVWSEHVPLLILGIFPIVAVTLLIPMPETKDYGLPDTLEDGENFENKTANVMTDKHLINAVENCVDESLFGFSKLHPNLMIDFTRKIVFDVNSSADGKVALISGGGSGHEPFPAGYVGEGMLTATVSGSIFTSPSSNQVLHAIHLAAAKCTGVLLLIPNYTGDVLNFGLAIENALGEGLAIDSVVVGEDVAQEIRGVPNKAGKRGMCGLILVFKIAGYLAQKGYDLAAVKKFSVEAVRSTASMGLCVSPCSKPGVGLLFRLEKDEMEVGIGVHGEAGIARIKMLSARKAVEMLLEYLMPCLKVAEGDEVVALLNNLGSLSHIEQWLLAGELDKQLLGKKIKVVRLYAGCFFTSLNMVGFQICLLKLNRVTKQMFLEALDHPTMASAWPKIICRPAEIKNVTIGTASLGMKKTFTKSFFLSSKDSEFFKRCFFKISRELTKQETYLNYLDSSCGDGDCGTTFTHLATLIREAEEKCDFSNPANLFFYLSLTIEKSIGGTTGALYSLFLKGCSKELENFTNLNAFMLFKCWKAGVEAIKKYSLARLGDRTMLDSLEIGCQTFENLIKYKSVKPEEAFRKAVKAAKEGCERTKLLEAFAGRASYTNQSRQKDVDAGAYAVTVWLSAIQSVLDERKLAQID